MNNVLIPEESIEILVELGLTQTEAKVYMALLCLKSATARNIHRASKVARQDVYQLLSDLQEKGLIEKILEKPAKFKPIPANEAISILTQRRNEQNSQLKKRAINHFRDFEGESAETLPLDGVTQFALLSKSETNPTGHIDKIGKAVDNAQKSVMCSITFPVFMKVKSMHEHIWKKAMKRNVKFKFIIYRKPNEKADLTLDPILEKSDNFKIRWTSTVTPAIVLLVDEREAFCRMGRDIDCPVLFSLSPSFVALIRDYFETKWKSLKHRRKRKI
jgi:sugar-specific transcriptional regulator TrmB